MKKSTQRIITILSVMAVILLFSFFLRDVLVPLIRFQMANDVDGARALLTSQGVLGFLAVILLVYVGVVALLTLPSHAVLLSATVLPAWSVTVTFCVSAARTTTVFEFAASL